MGKTYKVPMKKAVLAIFLIFVAAVTAAVVWCFRSGFMWSAICLIAVAGPLSVFYWYMIYITPKRAAITVAEEGILLAAPPFASAVIPWASVVKTFPANLNTDEAFKVVKSKKLMHFAGYRSGQIIVKDNREAIVVAKQPEVLCIQTEDRFYLLGPADLEGFTAEVAEVFGK
ncbi:PH domain-containing protein [Pseudodesulfovibrio sp. zrk46]|uniref:PH domain-containing protein n=1 Tax=Pseudodesulfovibrio sp. zrk46 TaxID=2725288 RepID=UPI00144981B0|nr:PH domain-containing protein [Pseudodesulfovibrio sp. zrk46]QJB55031.1 hypothetical protein HFN16_00835 [Pseudodesulfovibrio sp. zrk46]